MCSACDDITGAEPSCLARPPPVAGGDLTPLIRQRGAELARPGCTSHYLSLVYIASGVVLWYLHTTIHQPPFFTHSCFSKFFPCSFQWVKGENLSRVQLIMWLSWYFQKNEQGSCDVHTLKFDANIILYLRKCHTNHIVMHSNLSE